MKKNGAVRSFSKKKEFCAHMLVLPAQLQLRQCRSRQNPRHRCHLLVAVSTRR